MGDYVQLTCIATRGNVPIGFEWSLNNVKLQNELATVATIGEHTSLLLIHNATAQHAGEYACMAGNKVGKANRTAKLIVQGRQF